jgi:type VI secretion system protein ImpJ
MRPAQKLVWSEGMLMSPHHLQQLDRYHEELLEQRLRGVIVDDWGVSRLEIDPRGLETGQLRLQAFQGVLPEGLVLAFEAGDSEAPAVRPIEAHFGATAAALEVYLGVPRERDGVASVGEPGRAGRARYVATARRVFDTTTGTDEAQLAFAQRQVALLFGDEPREDMEAMKIAEIVRTPSGALAVSEAYVPPCLRVSASPVLLVGVRRVLALAAAQQRTLSEARRQREDATVEFTAKDVTRFLLLSAVNSFLPVLAHFAQAGDLPPRSLYLSLCQFAGALSTFVAEAEPVTLPPFAFGDLRATFEPVFARILSLLGATVRETFLRVPLEPRQDGMHLGEFGDERLHRATTFVLKVKSSQLSEAQIAEHLPRLSKIASWTDIAHLVQAASPGVAASVTHRLPSEIPVRAGFVYFTLNATDRHWRNVVHERNLAVYLPPPFSPGETQLELLAVPPPGSLEAPGR